MLILLLPFLTACEIYFNPVENEIARIENITELENAANGVYALLSSAINDPAFYYLNKNADDLTHGHWGYNELYGVTLMIGQFRQNTFDEDLNYTWTAFYEVIATANHILSQINPQTTNNKEYQKILGEVLMLRAYAYFRLTRTYGQIPMIKDVEINYAVTKSTYEEIYQAIEDDLLLACQLLPASLNESRVAYETPHRGMAKAMLAEVYLSWAGYPAKNTSKYAMAATTSKEIIDSAAVYGMEIMDDFAQLWDQAHRYNKESVFTIYYTPGELIERGKFVDSYYTGQAEFDYNFNGDYTYTYLLEGLLLNSEVLLEPGRYNISQVKFYNDYPNGYRKDITFFNEIYYPVVDSTANILDTGYVHIDKVSIKTRLNFRKFFYDPYYITPVGSNNTKVYGDQKTYLFRFAQTLLTYAEASARSGQLNEQSYECVNQIRRRAHHLNLYAASEYDLTPGLSSSAFADSVVQERAWELAAEPEGRWFDLLRLEKMDELPAFREKGEGVFKNLGPSYFLPIPTSDILLNPNLEE